MFQLIISTAFLEKAFHQVILGIVQGLTEFLPISSTAHLTVIPRLLGWGDPGISTIASIQLGSVFAVFIYFWPDLVDLLKGFSHLLIRREATNQRAKLSAAVLLGNVPIVFTGLLIKIFWPNYESSFLRTIPSIAIISIAMAFLLWISELRGNRSRTLEFIRPIDGLFIGLTQVLAIIPGVSRSGITISSGLLMGMTRDSAARFSFLLGLPAITLAGLVEIKEVDYISTPSNFALLIIGITSAALFSWISIDFLIKYLRRSSLSLFVYYRIVFGVGLLILFFNGLFD